MKEIKGHPNYLISNDGLIYLKHTLKRLSIHLDRGYPRVSLRVGDRYKQFMVHRLVATTYLDNPHNLSTVNHKDMNKLNNSVDNLEWMTHGQNSVHAARSKDNPNLTQTHYKYLEIIGLLKRRGLIKGSLL